MTLKRKDQIRALLKSIETGDTTAIAVVNEEKYIQHNPHTQEGNEGLATLFKRLSKTFPSVNIVRAFADGNFIFAQTEYNFSSEKIGFEVFRFEDGMAVEHWDNIQRKQGPNASGHSMTNGCMEITDLELTEFNRQVVHSFVDDVLINRQLEKLELYIDSENYTQHNPHMMDGIVALRTQLEKNSNDEGMIKYDYIHRILAEGNFVLSTCEGALAGVHSAFYDLFRVRDGKLVEHWDTIEAIPPRVEWKNDNGKF